MARCARCKHPYHDQFLGHPGRWLCMCPYRSEIDNSGNFTFPKNRNPAIVICETPTEDFGDRAKHKVSLEQAKTPIWCYYEAVDQENERRKQAGEQPFDPAVQRKILYEK